MNLRRLSDDALLRLLVAVSALRTRLLLLCFVVLSGGVTLAVLHTATFEAIVALLMGIASIIYYHKYTIARDLARSAAEEIVRRATLPEES
jgi:hypothetical protein